MMNVVIQNEYRGSWSKDSLQSKMEENDRL